MSIDPIHDRCLHVRRTLDQFYYNTLPEANSRTTSQVVYKFAKKQTLKQEGKYKPQSVNDEETGQKMTQGSARSHKGDPPEKNQRFNGLVSTSDERTQGKGAQVENWDPPKVLMVDQLWLWVIDNSQSRTR